MLKTLRDLARAFHGDFDLVSMSVLTFFYLLSNLWHKHLLILKKNINFAPKF